MASYGKSQKLLIIEDHLDMTLNKEMFQCQKKIFCSWIDDFYWSQNFAIKFNKLELGSFTKSQSSWTLDKQNITECYSTTLFFKKYSFF